MGLLKLNPFDVDGHRVRAETTHVSPWGPKWFIEIDNVQTDGGLDARFDDSEEFVRQHMIHQVRGKLAALQKQTDAAQRQTRNA